LRDNLIETCNNNYRLALEKKLGFFHFQVDGTAGYLAGIWLLTFSTDVAFLLILGYNLLAFACQPLVAVFPKSVYKNGVALALGLSALALILPVSACWFSMVAAGVSSSIFHVCAGALSLNTAAGDHRRFSWFLAPGVLGLLSGVAAGSTQQAWITFALPLLLLFSISVIFFTINNKNKFGVISDPKNISTPSFHCSSSKPWLFWMIIVLLLLMAGRSASWFFYHGHTVVLTTPTLLLFAIMACFGKFFGGMLSNRFGTHAIAIIGLLMASTCFYMAEIMLPIVFIALGLACLQSGTPGLLITLNEQLKNSALSAALGLGIVVALGGFFLLAIMTNKQQWIEYFWGVPVAIAFIHIA